MTRLFRFLLFALLLGAIASCSANSGPVTALSKPVPLKPDAPAVALSVSPHSVREGGSVEITWQTSDATSCMAAGAWSGAEPLSDSAGLSWPMNKTGTYTFTLACDGPGGETTVSQSVLVGQVPAPTIQVALIPASIKPGDSATITWSSTNADVCEGMGGTGSDGWAAAQASQNLGGLNTGPIAKAGEYSYELSCTGPGGNANQSRILSVSTSAPAAPPAVTLAAVPGFIAPGQSTVLSWHTSNATSCSASGGSGADAWSGTQPIISTGASIGPLSVVGNYSYTLTCTGAGGSASASATVIVSTAPTPPPVTVSISVSPQTIAAGASAALTWSSTNADSCTALGSWSGAQALTGTSVSTGTLIIPGIYTYTLNCVGSGGSASGSASATLTVTPLAGSILAFTAIPPAIPAGQYVTLAWVSLGATSCAASGGSGSDGWNGAVALTSIGTAIGPLNTAGHYTYTLVCTGPGGASPPSSVNVTVTGASAAADILTFRALPNTLQTGQSTLLSWTTIAATSCTASGGTGSDGWNGAKPILSVGTAIGPLNAAGNYTYTLTCTGPGGTSAPVSVGVNVNSTPPAAAITSFSALPTLLQVGQSITLAWTTLNATACTASDGTGSDGWSGARPISSAGTQIGPINTAGTYNYVLACTGPGGAGLPASAAVIVTAAPPPAGILLFTAIPSDIQTGQSFTLSWTSVAATSCTATGGTGSDSWHGSVGVLGVGTIVGPLSTAGHYTYTLTCTGPGGASAPSSVVVNVTTAVPAASISSFTAAPILLQVGQSTVLSWSSSNATSCDASGGTGSDGWNGSVATSSVATSAGPFNTAGIYVYNLTCTGAGGASLPSSVAVTVAPALLPATIIALAAVPGTVQTGQSTTLTWATAGATACTASGGSGSDGWNGSVGTLSVAKLVGPLTAVGTVTYTLTCTGPGGASAPSSVDVIVKAPVVGQPTVSLTINGNNPAQIQPGQSPSLSWTSTNATSCTASGGTGSDGWSGAKATVGTGVVVGPINTPGVYSYTLTCTGSGGSGSSSAVLTVISSSTAQCGVGEASSLLLAPAATASSAVNGLCLLGCGVSNLSNVTDSVTTNFSTLTVGAGVAATVSLRVTDNTTSYPAGRTVGFLMADGNSLLSVALLSNVSVVTSLNGTVQETARISDLLKIQALGLLYDPDAGYLEFLTKKPFNSVSLSVSSLASVLSSLKVYGACVTLQ